VTHFLSGTDPKMQVRLQGVPSSVSGFTVSGDIDDKNMKKHGVKKIWGQVLQKG